MLCPYCKIVTARVVDTRLVENGTVVRRRRQCDQCSERFTTYERCEALPLMVIKKDKRREPFNRLKLEEGIKDACKKRKIPAETIQNLMDYIEGQALDSSSRHISSEEIGKMVLEKLKQLDEVSYIRFASVYKGFEDSSYFIKEAKELKPGIFPRN